MRDDRTEERLEQEVDREESSHGSRWSSMHGGYFSDPQIARVLLDCMAPIVQKERPDVIVDMGGGTGFLLDQLAGYGISSAIRLIDLDLSDAQLKQIANPRIEPVRKSALAFARQDVADDGEGLVFMTRSAIHYAGILGLKPWLQHIRKQMREGEYFVHQTACFEEMKDSLCLNELYGLMNSEKWYPTIEAMERAMSQTGFAIETILHAPPLELTSVALCVRYDISPKKMDEIRKTLTEEYGKLSGTFEADDEHFDSWLHYRIFVCRAV